MIEDNNEEVKQFENTNVSFFNGYFCFCWKYIVYLKEPS